MKIGSKLKGLREKSGYTQTQVASYLGLDQTTIAKIENDERNASVVVIEKMADLYGCELLDISSEETCAPLVLAFRAKNVDMEDMEGVAKLKKLALNIRMMKRLINGGVDDAK